MDTQALGSFRSHFGKLPDPRVLRSQAHAFLDILVIGFLSVLCGGTGWEHMTAFGEAKETWLRERLGLTLENGIPSEDTFRRVFAALDPEAFGECFREWVACFGEVARQKVIAVDGKTLRHSFDHVLSQPAVHMVRAWAADARLVLGAVPTETKSNEIPAVRRLLGLLDLRGAIVTADAEHAQKETAACIREKGGEYVLALKDNHPHLSRDASLCLQNVRHGRAAARDWAQAAPGRSVHTSTQHDAGHGRFEERTTTVLTLAEQDPDWGDVQQEWSGLRAFVFVDRVRRCARPNEEPREERHQACFLASFTDTAQRLGTLVRKHWRIENCLHWVLDVQLREDACTVRRDNGPANLAILRDCAIGLLHRRPRREGGTGIKQKRAGWDHKYLLNVLA